MKERSKMGKPVRAYWVSNDLNFMYSLAAGMIMPPAGFGDKYYKDTLAAYPGWIPLFFDKVPMRAIEYSTEEAWHLKPVILEVECSGLGGIALEEARKGTAQLGLFEQGSGLSGTARGLVTRAPLPIERIVRAHFQSDEDRDRFLDQSRLRNNVRVASPGMLRRRKTLFTRALKRWKWRPLFNWESEPLPVWAAQAVGGILAMLYLVSGKSSVAKETCRAAFYPPEGGCQIEGLVEWIERGETVSPDESLRGYLLWECVSVLARNRMECNDDDLDGLILDFLAGIPAEFRHRLEPLCNSLNEIGELGGSTVSQLFQRHPTPLGRALIMLFLRRRCSELLEFHRYELNELDFVLAAILFGARSGWLRLPLDLRGNADLQAAVTYRMAAFCHRGVGPETPFGDPPPMPEVPDPVGWARSATS